MTISGTVLLDRTFISLASDPTQYFSCGTSGSAGGGGQRSDTYTLEGSFRVYANNNTRLITTNASTRTLTITFRALTPAQVTQALSFVGKTVLLRDTYGRKMWGSYTVVTQTDIPRSGAANVDLQTDVVVNFQVVSYTEGV